VLIVSELPLLYLKLFEKNQGSATKNAGTPSPVAVGNQA